MRAKSKPELGEVVVYAEGLCALSACAPKDMDRADLLAVINSEHPTGIRSSWSFDNAPRFRTGQPNPCPCEQEPGDRMHYLFAC